MILRSLALAGGGIVISPSSVQVLNVRVGNPCWAGVRFNALGTELSNTPANSFTVSRGDWLDRGDSTGVWIERTINSGPGFNITDPGAGRHQLSTNREFNQQQVPLGTRVTNVTFDFWDAASGGNLLDSVTYNVTAENSL